MDAHSLPATLSAPPPDDPWLAPDKLGHFIMCAGCAAAGYIACLRRPSWRRWRHAAGLLLATTVGAAKEIGDGLGWWPGNVSLRDMGADAAGAAVGLALLTAYDPWLTSRFSASVTNKHEEAI